MQVKFMSDRIKELIDKSQAYDLLAKKTRGYAFDSLIFRFKDYQSRAFRAEVLQMKYDKNMTEVEATRRVQDRHNRDLMRFIHILDEVIGEHD